MGSLSGLVVSGAMWRRRNISNSQKQARALGLGIGSYIYIEEYGHIGSKFRTSRHYAENGRSPFSALSTTEIDKLDKTLLTKPLAV